MTEPGSSETDRSMAVHAYEHAREANVGVRHRLDVVDEPILEYGGAPRRRRMCLPWRSMRPRREHVDHALVDPTATAFKAGFGFAAGTGLFRLLALSGVLTALFLLVVLLASSTIR